MTLEWLEEQLSKALDAVDKRDAEINELKDIISELLPINEDNECISCVNGTPGGIIHETGALCLCHPLYDRARKVLEIGTGAQE